MLRLMVMRNGVLFLHVSPCFYIINMAWQHAGHVGLRLTLTRKVKKCAVTLQYCSSSSVCFAEVVLCYLEHPVMVHETDCCLGPGCKLTT